MYNPKVTVVLPIYNVEKYLNRCIQSVVNQSYNNQSEKLSGTNKYGKSSTIKCSMS